MKEFVFLFLSTIACALGCTTYQEATLLTVTKAFTGILLGEPQCVEQNQNPIIAPSDLVWHIYEIEDSNEARIQTNPEGLVSPFVQDGVLRFRHPDKDLANEGDILDTSISLFLQESQLQSLEVDGSNIHAEVFKNISTGAFEVTDSGLQNELSIIAPNVAVRYLTDVTFQGGKLALEAATAALTTKGSDVSIVVKANQVELIHNDTLGTIVVEGEVISGLVYGPRNTIFVNNAISSEAFLCESVDILEPTSQCVTTNTNVTIPKLECSATSKAIPLVCSSSSSSSRSSSGKASQRLVIPLRFASLLVLAALFY